MASMAHGYSNGIVARRGAQRSLPIALVVVDDFEAANLVPPDLENLLASDAESEAAKNSSG
jgi:hypothetical protein